MRIIFKNVGQGDSIILEWQKNGINHIGIIDCNKISSFNPTLDYLKLQKSIVIDFLILSHPHQDHYSGMLQLLDYCAIQKLNIGFFGCTLFPMPEYWKWFEEDEADNMLFRRIYDKVNECYTNKLIPDIQHIVNLNWTYKLNEDFELISLSPTQSELHSFKREVDKHKNTESLKARNSANLLSTVFKLVNTKTNQFAILTSDVELEALNRISERNNEIFEGELLLCQIPHHGSIKNHKIGFWEQFTKQINCPSVISAGEHKKYNHPDKEVVFDFVRANFKVRSTNNINGMRDFMDSLKTDTIISKLDDDSELVIPYNIDGDQIF